MSAWQFEDVAPLAVEANGHLPLPLCDWTPEELARIAAFEGAPTPPEVREAAVVEELARALRDLVPELGARALTWERSLDVARRLVDDPRVAATVAAYRATQDGGAEEAVRRVEAVAAIWESVATTWQETADHPNTGPDFRAHCLAERDDFRDRVSVLRAAIGEPR